MGSKASICEQICSIFPKADNFYDLFGGGFSVTHCMLIKRSKDFKQFHFNEIRKGMTELIQEAINGEYSYENFKPKFIDREEFKKNKETDLYIKLIWSFGNSGAYYLFGKDIEHQKKSLHNAIIFNQFDDFAKNIIGLEKYNDSYSIYDRRVFVKNRLRVLSKGKLDLEQLERLQRLEQLQQLQQLEQLLFCNKSYDEIEIKPNSIIYCDPPYESTTTYDGNNKFNSKQFLEWASNQSCPVFISEYNVSDKRFKLVKSINKRSLLASDRSKTLIKKENIYVNKIGYEKLIEAIRSKK